MTLRAEDKFLWCNQDKSEISVVTLFFSLAAEVAPGHYLNYQLEFTCKSKIKASLCNEHVCLKEWLGKYILIHF